MARDIQRINDRNAKMYKRYKEMYDVKRIRHDDVLSKLADEFYLDEATINRIIIKVSQEEKEKENE